MFCASEAAFFLLVAGTFYSVTAQQVGWTELKAERLPVCPSRNHHNISLSCRYKQNVNFSLDGITISQLAAGEKDVWLVKKSIRHLSGSTPSYVKHNEEEIIIPYNYTFLKGSNITFRCEAYYTSGVTERYNITPVFLDSTDKECSLRDEKSRTEKTTEDTRHTSYKSHAIGFGVAALVAVLFCAVVVGLLVFLWRRRRKPLLNKYREPGDTEDTEPLNPPKKSEQDSCNIPRPTSPGLKLSEAVSKFQSQLRLHLKDKMLDLNKRLNGHFLGDKHIKPQLFYIPPVISAKETEHHTSRTVKIDELFRKPNAIRVLLYGAAGTGKSTVTQKIASDWATEDTRDKEDALVFHLECSELTLRKDAGDYTLAKLLRRFHAPDQTPEPKWEEVLEFINANPSRVLIIIDGLDELSGWDAARRPGEGMAIHGISLPGKLPDLIFHLVKKNILPQARVIVTSRQTATYESRLFDDVFVVSGFDDDAIQVCIDEMCATDIQKEKVREVIAKNHQLKSFCVVPLTCVLSIALIIDETDRDGGIAPERTDSPTHESILSLSNITQILLLLVLNLVHGKGAVDNKLEFTAQQEISLKTLCRIAANALLSDSPRSKLNDTDLTDVDSSDNTINALLGFDVDRSPGIRRLRSASFVHPSVQEFLAALHVCLNWEKVDLTQVTTIDQEFLSRLDNLQINTLGLLADKHLGHGLIQRLHDPPELKTDVLFERRDTFLNKILNSVEGINSVRSPGPGAISNLGKLHVIRCILEGNLGDNHVHVSSALLCTTKSDSGQEYDQVLSLRGIPGGLLPHATFSLGQHIAKHQDIHGIDLQETSITKKGFRALAQAGEGAFQKLRYVELSENKIGDDGLKQIANALKLCTDLQYLGMKNAAILDEGAGTMAEILHECSELKELALYGNNFKEAGARKLAVGLKHCKKLEYLRLDRSGFGEAASDITAALGSCDQIKYVSLEENQIGDNEVSALVDNLSACSELESLQLDNNDIGDEGAIAFARGIKNWPKLKTLHLEVNKITVVGARVLTTILKSQSEVTIRLFEQKPKPLDSADVEVAAELKDRILM